MSHTIDSVLDDAVKAVASRDPDNKEKTLGADVIQAAKTNLTLQKALAVLDQAVTRSRDSVKQYGAIDPVESKNNAEAIASARSMLQALALALEIGTLIIDRTEESFGNPKLVGDPAKDKRRPVKVHPEVILSKPEDRESDELRSGTIEDTSSPVAPLNPAPGPPVAEPGKPGEGPELQPAAHDFGPIEPPPAPGPVWPVVAPSESLPFAKAPATSDKAKKT